MSVRIVVSSGHSGQCHGDRARVGGERSATDQGGNPLGKGLLE